MLRQDRYARRFDVVGAAWDRTLRHLRMRQSLRHAFLVPVLYSSTYAGMGSRVGKPQYLTAMEYAFREDASIISAREMRKLLEKIFAVFNVEGDGMVDFHEVICVFALFQLSWDAEPRRMILGWFRLHDGDIGGGLRYSELMKVLLTLAVTQDEVGSVLSALDSAVLRDITSQARSKTRGAAEAEASRPALPAPVAIGEHTIDMYAGIPVGPHGAAGRPRRSSSGGSERSVAGGTTPAGSVVAPGTDDRLRLSSGKDGRSDRAGGFGPPRRRPSEDGAFPGGMLPSLSPRAGKASRHGSSTSGMVVDGRLRRRSRRPADPPKDPGQLSIGGALPALPQARGDAKEPAAASQVTRPRAEARVRADRGPAASHALSARGPANGVRFDKRMLSQLLSRSPGLVRAIHRLRIVRALPAVRARIIRARLQSQIKETEKQYETVNAQLRVATAARFWHGRTTKRWFAQWIKGVTAQKQQRIKVWRHRVRVALRFWSRRSREQQAWRRQRRLAAVHGYMLLQRRAMVRLKEWFADRVELRTVQAGRADAAFALRLRERFLHEWHEEARTRAVLRRYCSIVCGRVFAAWRADAKLTRHHKLLIAAAGSAMKAGLASADDAAEAERAVAAMNAEHEATTLHASMEHDAFLQEASLAAELEATVGEEERSAAEAASAARGREIEAARSRAAMARHDEWLATCEREAAALARAQVEAARQVAAAVVDDAMRQVPDWSLALAGDDDSSGLGFVMGAVVRGRRVKVAKEPPSDEGETAFEALVAWLEQPTAADGPARATRGRLDVPGPCAAIAGAMARVASAATPAEGRQGFSEWVAEAAEDGSLAGFISSLSGDRLRAGDMTAVDVLDVACAHLVGAASRRAERAAAMAEHSLVRSRAADRLASMLGRLFRARRFQKAAAEARRQCIEELVDRSTGDVVYVSNVARATLPGRPRMLGSKPLRRPAEWALRIEPETGVAYYEHRKQAWRSRRDPPRGRLLCFACHLDLADRRCLGAGCDGYAYCWHCWDAYHPLDQPEFAAHASTFDRLKQGPLPCSQCPDGSRAAARHLVWDTGYPLLCTACKTATGADPAKLVQF